MHPYKGTNPARIQEFNQPETFVDEIQKVRQEPNPLLKQTAETMKKFYDRKKGRFTRIFYRDKVWLEGTNITTTRPSSALEINDTALL